MKLYDGEYACRMIDLPGSIHAASRITQDGSDFPNIYINDQLSPMGKRRAFDHEMDHLENDDFYNNRSIEEVEEYK